ncbi:MULTISPECIES: hypothetical protein [unclassified Streptomyces]|uniref:hypothetical protein n=1 Tax=unclassified Streptomyces TaxID=2593676 RepID=UPI001BE60D53|nr:MULTISPECIES: hypothetical protein [unclassified Streptomyces]MBT2406459.1 hypothetical protein [Streptomyces sp. ISL-21]MBT2612467.1 hypothetical protein [Streptomyces sp. ISL-87]
MRSRSARLFRLLSVPRLATLDLAGAAALAGLEPSEAERYLERVTELGLLESPAPFTYRFHDLLREFAAARSRQCDGQERTAALLRLADHILACARNAYAAERPGHPLTDLPDLLTPTVSNGTPSAPSASSAPSTPSTPSTPSAPEREGRPPLAFHPEAVLAVAVQTVEAAPSAVGLVADAVLALDPLLDGSFLWAALIAPAHRILRAAGEQGHVRAAGRIGYMLGAALTRLGKFDGAEGTLQDAERAARVVADEVVRTEILTCRALVRQGRADWGRADALYREAITVGAACGNVWGTTNALSNSVSALLNLRRFGEAAEAGRASLTAARDSEDRYGEAHALYSLGIVARHTGSTDEAIARHRQSAELGVRWGYPAFEVMNLISETAAHLAANRPWDAAECGDRALAAARRVGWRAAEGRTLHLLGTALAAVGDRDRARARLKEAMVLLGALGLPEAAKASAVLASLPTELRTELPTELRTELPTELPTEAAL